MDKLYKIAKVNWPVLPLGLIVIILLLTNYRQETFLTGWDNLHPEFDFETNIKRSLFAVWQEYQGLGLLGGMGHASDLPRQIFLWLLSFLLPTNLLRYTWVFLTLFIGAAGAYKLIEYILKAKRGVIQEQNREEPEAGDAERGAPIERPQRSEDVGWGCGATGPARATKAISALGGLFYLLNLSTIQTFYAPFEAFTAHFAALPWLLFASIKYFNEQSKKNLIFLSITLLLSTPQSYIPTLFVVYGVASFILGFFIFSLPISLSRFWEFINRILRFSLVIFIINSFWLLPFIYFTFTNAQVNLNAKINQMATEEVFLRNKEFGNLTDVMLLKGFWFNNVEPNLEGNYSYMLLPWREHLSNPAITTIGYFLFAIVLVGVGIAIKAKFVGGDLDLRVAHMSERTERSEGSEFGSASEDEAPTKKRILFSFAILFLFSFTMLSTATPPFSWINELIRQIPLINQAFRFPFTKFSILASLAYSLFFALGIYHITNWLRTIQARFKIYDLGFKIFYLSFSIFIFSLLIFFTLPAFRGHLFYERERLAIPKEYFQLFDFFKNQDPNTRIANFPQPTIWGWTFYTFGYSGSGFPWYGIKQPILDRAFDVWSRQNENYYNEISYALYSKNPALTATVLNKYQITWLVVDKNVINPPSPSALFIDQIESQTKEIPSIQKVAQFGKIDIYKVALRDPLKNYVFLTSKLPITNGYNWNNLDQAYTELGNYLLTTDNKSLITNNYSYPFRSLFSGKTQKDIEFNISEAKDSIDLTSNLYSSYEVLSIPNLSEKENIIQTEILSEVKNGEILVFIKILTPQIFIADRKIWGEEYSMPIFKIPDVKNISFPLNLNINGGVNFPIENANKSVGITFLSLREDNIFVLKDRNHPLSSSVSIDRETLAQLTMLKHENIDLAIEAPKKVTVLVPKIDDRYLSALIPLSSLKIKNCDRYRRGNISSKLEKEGGKDVLVFTSRNATACTSFSLANLPHDEAYVIFIEAKNVKGRPLHFWIENIDQKTGVIDTYLAGNTTSHTFVLPPMEKFGRAYTLHFDNVSIGESLVSNSISKIALYPLPYRFLTSLFFSTGGIEQPTPQKSDIKVSHPNESLYTISLRSTDYGQQSTIVLSQSYNPGWKAYQITSNEPVSLASRRGPAGRSRITNLLNLAFPFIFGEEIKNHVLVNNWENGWSGPPLSGGSSPASEAKTGVEFIIVYFPQYLEYFGFLILGTYFTFLLYFVLRKRRHSPKLTGIGMPAQHSYPH